MTAKCALCRGELKEDEDGEPVGRALYAKVPRGNDGKRTAYTFRTASALKLCEGCWYTLGEPQRKLAEVRPVVPPLPERWVGASSEAAKRKARRPRASTPRGRKAAARAASRRAPAGPKGPSTTPSADGPSPSSSGRLTPEEKAKAWAQRREQEKPAPKRLRALERELGRVFAE